MRFVVNLSAEKMEESFRANAYKKFKLESSFTTSNMVCVFLCVYTCVHVCVCVGVHIRVCVNAIHTVATSGCCQPCFPRTIQTISVSIFLK